MNTHSFDFQTNQTSAPTDMTHVEYKLQRTEQRLIASKKHLEQYIKRTTDTASTLAKIEEEYRIAKDTCKKNNERFFTYILYYDKKISELEKELATYRLMNDIRLGKIIPVVAENGTVADVTFS